MITFLLYKIFVFIKILVVLRTSLVNYAFYEIVRYLLHCHNEIMIPIKSAEFIGEEV